ncbi:MAG: 30S ribosomal protein S15 [Candidatus Micrarchaeota archaeon]
MARLHTRRRGRSASHKPSRSTASLWVAQSKDEILALIEQLAKSGKSEAEIGLILRDLHGIPSVKALAGKTISQVLAEKKIAPKYPSDLIYLIKRAMRMRKHLGASKKDVLNRGKLAHVESKIRRLVKYYRGRKLPSDWSYDPETAALLVK